MRNRRAWVRENSTVHSSVLGRTHGVLAVSAAADDSLELRMLCRFQWTLEDVPDLSPFGCYVRGEGARTRELKLVRDGNRKAAASHEIPIELGVVLL